MVTVQPFTYSPEALALGRITDPVVRSVRGQQVPEVLPPAVILPRTAAWLNPVTITPAESVAATETSPDQSTGGQSGSLFVPVAQTGAAAGLAAQTVTAQTLAAQTLAAQTAVAQPTSANAAAAVAATPPGFGSVLQLV